MTDQPTIVHAGPLVLMDTTTYDDLIMRVLTAEADAEAMRERAYQLGLASIISPPEHP